MTAGALSALLRCAAVLSLLSGIAAPAHAENLAQVRTTPLPTLQADAEPAGLATVDGATLLLAGDGRAWRLDVAGSRWRPVAADASAGPGRVDGVFGDGATAYRIARAPDGTVAIGRLRESGGRLRLEALPPLPVALESVQGAASGDQVYLAGEAGGRARLYRWAPAAVQWQAMATWPGHAPASTLAVHRGAVFATVPAPGAADRAWRWDAERGWREAGVAPGPIVPGSARSIGQAHVAYLVAPGDGRGPARLATLHVITGSWADVAAATAPAGARASPWTDGLAWVARSANGQGLVSGHLQFHSDTLLLKWLDWLVIVVYLALMVGVGLYFYLGERRASTASFFVGGRSIPFWAAGVSLYATNVSSISFIAIPAKAFETNWQYLANNLMAVLGLVFVAIWIVPLLRRLDLMSVFSYLELRFHPAIRMIASALCIVTQIVARMSVILFLPSLAIATITGIDVVWSVLLMGGFTILYTTLGGMKAVIWTDFTQVFVMFGGALFAIAYIVGGIDGGMAEFIATAAAEDKTRIFDFSFDLTKATIWGFIFLVLFDVVLTFPKDQVLMQRVLSTRSDRDAGRSVWMFAAMMIPGGVLFYTIGTALYVFYKAHPERLDPLLPIDATFPLFIAAELPMGVTGLIIAGIFAAAMSTLSSIINSVSTMASVDFFDRLVKDPSPRASVLFAEWTGVVVGLIGIGMALVLSRYDIHSLLDISIELFGLFGGGFAGAYTLGMMTRRANSQGVAIGIGASVVLTMIAWWFDLVHPYFYLAISILLCIVFGYVGSLFFPPPGQSLRGLTLYAQDAAPPQPLPVAGTA